MAPSSSAATRSAIRSNGVSGQFLVTARLNQRVELPYVEGHAAEPRQPHRVEMAGVHEAPDTPHAHAEVLRRADLRRLVLPAVSRLHGEQPGGEVGGQVAERTAEVPDNVRAPLGDGTSSWPRRASGL